VAAKACIDMATLSINAAKVVQLFAGYGVVRFVDGEAGMDNLLKKWFIENLVTLFL
jgi:hypothetical protein